MSITEGWKHYQVNGQCLRKNNKYCESVMQQSHRRMSQSGLKFHLLTMYNQKDLTTLHEMKV